MVYSRVGRTESLSTYFYILLIVGRARSPENMRTAAGVVRTQHIQHRATEPTSGPTSATSDSSCEARLNCQVNNTSHCCCVTKHKRLAEAQKYLISHTAPGFIVHTTNKKTWGQEPYWMMSGPEERKKRATTTAAQNQSRLRTRRKRGFLFLCFSCPKYCGRQRTNTSREPSIQLIHVLWRASRDDVVVVIFH